MASCASLEQQLQGALTVTQNALLGIFPTLESAYEAFSEAPAHLKKDYAKYLECRWPKSDEIIYQTRINAITAFLIQDKFDPRNFSHVPGYPELTRLAMYSFRAKSLNFTYELLTDVGFDRLEPYFRTHKILFKTPSYLEELRYIIHKKRFALIAKIVNYLPIGIRLDSPLFVHLLKSNRTDVDWDGKIDGLAVELLLTCMQNPESPTGFTKELALLQRAPPALLAASFKLIPKIACPVEVILGLIRRAKSIPSDLPKDARLQVLLANRKLTWNSFLQLTSPNLKAKFDTVLSKLTASPPDLAFEDPVEAKICFYPFLFKPELWPLIPRLVKQPFFEASMKLYIYASAYNIPEDLLVSIVRDSPFREFDKDQNISLINDSYRIPPEALIPLARRIRDPKLIIDFLFDRYKEDDFNFTASLRKIYSSTLFHGRELEATQALLDYALLRDKYYHVTRGLMRFTFDVIFGYWSKVGPKVGQSLVFPTEPNTTLLHVFKYLKATQLERMMEGVTDFPETSIMNYVFGRYVSLPGFFERLYDSKMIEITALYRSALMFGQCHIVLDMFLKDFVADDSRIRTDYWLDELCKDSSNSLLRRILSGPRDYGQILVFIGVLLKERPKNVDVQPLVMWVRYNRAMISFATWDDVIQSHLSKAPESERLRRAYLYGA